MRRARWSAAMALAGHLLAGATFSSPVSAEPSLDLRHFRPPSDPRGGLALEPTATLGPGSIVVGAWTSLAERPVTLEADGERVAVPIRHQLSLDTMAMVGLGRTVAVWARLPTVLAQRGDDLSEQLPGATPLPTTAIGDVVAGAKLALWSSPAPGGLGLAAIGELTAPTGNERSFVGEGAPTATLRALAGIERRQLSVRSAVGPRLRAETSSYLGTELGHELDWALGAVWREGRERPGRWEGHVELHGALALTPELLGARRSPAFAAFTARRRLSELSLLAGLEAPLDGALGVPRVRAVLGIAWIARDLREQRGSAADHGAGCEGGASCPDRDDDGDGIPDPEDACPLAPGTAADRGCPALDSDGDGIPDDRDWCPNRAEDHDGFQDEDGCPDLDNDGDGIPDLEDACPLEPGNQRSSSIPLGCPSLDRDGDTFDDVIDACPDSPEDFDGHEDDDGCPDGGTSEGVRPRSPLATLATVTGATSVHWRSPPRFAERDGVLVIEPDSFPSVRALAQLLTADSNRVARVAVRPASSDEAATERARAATALLVATLRELSHRESAATAAERDAATLVPSTAPGEVAVTIERLPGPESGP